MSREDPRNIAWYCDKHAPKPIGFKGDPKTLIGKNVKRAFHCEEGIEHMWVLVQSITDDNVLLGKLNNDPTYDHGIAFGDEVKVQISEIEEIL